MTMKRTLTELLDEHARSVLENVHVSMPGIVQSYDASSQTCSVLPAVKKPCRDINNEIVYESHPVIANVPVAFPAAGPFGVHFDLVAGDTVWLVFSELSIAEFLANGAESEPTDVATHSLGSPIAIPLRLTSKFQTLKNGKRIGIDNDDAQIDFAAGKVKIVPSATLPAARKTDPVKVTVTPTILGTLAGMLVCAGSGSPPTVSGAATNFDVPGSITAGSGKVDIG